MTEPSKERTPEPIEAEIVPDATPPAPPAPDYDEHGVPSLDHLEERFNGLESQMWQGFANLERGQNVIVDLLRRRNGHDGEPPA